MLQEYRIHTIYNNMERDTKSERVAQRKSGRSHMFLITFVCVSVCVCKYKKLINKSAVVDGEAG